MLLSMHRRRKTSTRSCLSSCGCKDLHTPARTSTTWNINAVANTAIVENRYGGGVEVVSPMTAISETNILRAKAIHYNPGGFLRAAFKVDHLASYHRLG